MRRSPMVLLVGCLLVGCAQPRLITSITSSQDQIKMVYARANSTETGVIQCDVAADGSLDNCRKLPIHFASKKEANR